MRHEIIIENKTNSRKKSPVAGSGSASKDTSQSNEISKGTRAVAKTIVSFDNYVKPFVDQVVTQHITTVSLRTGAEELEERLSFAQSIGQRIYGLGKSVVVGALIGNIPGAIIGAVMNIATTAIEYSNKQRQIELQRNVEHVGLRYLNARAGGSVASFSGSRLKNQ